MNKIETQVDVTGRALRIGDKVATTLDGYSHLTVCKVLGFSPRTIRVEKPGGDWCRKNPDQVCFVAS